MRHRHGYGCAAFLAAATGAVILRRYPFLGWACTAVAAWIFVTDAYLQWKYMRELRAGPRGARPRPRQDDETPPVPTDEERKWEAVRFVVAWAVTVVIVGSLVVILLLAVPLSPPDVDESPLAEPRVSIVLWNVTEGTWARWREGPPGRERSRDAPPPYEVSVTVLSRNERVELQIEEEQGSFRRTRVISVHESAIPLAVAACALGRSVPAGEVRWVRGSPGGDVWTAELENYRVTVNLRPDAPPEIAWWNYDPGHTIGLAGEELYVVDSGDSTRPRDGQ